MLEVIALDDDGPQDDDFLSLVEAAEAKALTSTTTTTTKRRKLSPTRSTQEIPAPHPEGSYTAALKGSRSSLWQQQQQQEELKHRQPSTAGAAAGACFKCGLTGHWARDCGGGSGGGFGAGGGGGDEEVPEKLCPCGLGNCLVLTSNTVKNPGRKFYRCPARSENGGCNFFEWCDSSSSGLPTIGSASNYQSNPSAPDFPCPCGAGSCLVLVMKTGKNVGQQYYRCPASEGGSCGFFKWCNDQRSVSSQPAFTTQSQGVHSYSSSQSSAERNGSSCFKCGQEGHWARDCPKMASDSYADMGGNRVASSVSVSVSVSGSGSGSGSCFKCGKSGHWARACSSQETSAGSGYKKASGSFSSRYK